jgi:hypothetical protein
MEKATFRNILTRVLFIGIIVPISLFNISCKNNSTNDNTINTTNSNGSKNITIFEVLPSNESLLYNVEILQDRKLLVKFEGQKGKFEYKTNIEIGHSVTMNAVYQEESKEDITIRISKNGKLLRENSAKRGVFGTAYIID